MDEPYPSWLLEGVGSRPLWLSLCTMLVQVASGTERRQACRQPWLFLQSSEESLGCVRSHVAKAGGGHGGGLQSVAWMSDYIRSLVSHLARSTEKRVCSEPRLIF